MSQLLNDWNWLAGIFEGEGTASLRFNKGRWANSPRRAYLYVAISQTNEEMLKEVQRIAGCGKIYTQAARTDKHKQQWAWYIACKNAREFLTILLPFIRSPHKKQQVVNALHEDVLAREEGSRVRRENLNRCRQIRWEKYRASLSRA